MQVLWAAHALTADGWQSDVRIALGTDGRIASVAAGAAPEAARFGIVLPAPVNLHSHGFQRAMAGMAEGRNPGSESSFWSWRKVMYGFLRHLTPDDIEAITALAQMEMLEAGFGAVCEFHYLHHQPGGASYDNLAETSARVAAAAAETGIGLTLLPVYYRYGGCDGRALASEQLRFGNSPDRFARLVEGARSALAGLPGDAGLGIAPHSLRAVNREGLAFAVSLAPDAPLHLHIAEQTAEVDEVTGAWGAPPVEWLLANHDVDPRWCLVHATHMTPAETAALAETNAVAGLCPVTEANLGDGIFAGRDYLAAGGRFGIGSDSNIRISLGEELRGLEYSQRLRDMTRAVLASGAHSTGRVLFEGAARGGAQAAGRGSGRIEAGGRADLLALDGDAVDLTGKSGDALLDAYVFAGGERMLTDVWSAGRHVVTEGRHIRRAAITARYRRTILALQARM